MRDCRSDLADRDRSSALVPPRTPGPSAWPIAWRRMGSLRPWLVSVAVNEARQMVRRRRRHEVVSIDQPGLDLPGLDPTLRTELIDLATSLRGLSADERALLALRYVAGLMRPRSDAVWACPRPGSAAGSPDCSPVCERSSPMEGHASEASTRHPVTRVATTLSPRGACRHSPAGGHPSAGAGRRPSPRPRRGAARRARPR